MNKVSTTHAKTMVLLRSRKGMILALFETCGPISHVWLPSTHYRRQASRLPGTQAAGHPGPGVCECAAIQQAFHTRAQADQCWERHALIDDWSRDADMPQRVSDGRPSGLVAGASASFYGRAAARVPPASPGASAPGARQGHPGSPGGRAKRRGSRQSTGVCAPPPSQGPWGEHVMGPWRARPPRVRCPLAQKKGVATPHVLSSHAWKFTDRFSPMSGGLVSPTRVGPEPRVVATGHVTRSHGEETHG